VEWARTSSGPRKACSTEALGADKVLMAAQGQKAPKLDGLSRAVRPGEDVCRRLTYLKT